MDYDFFSGYGGKVVFYRNSGTPDSAIYSLEDSSFADVDVGNSSAPVFVDIDNDFDLDLFIGNGIGTIYFLKNIGSVNEPIWSLITNNYNSFDF